MQTSTCSPQGCPIIISDRENRLELTDFAGGVAFDLNSDGVAEHLSWTSGESEAAFLVLERNGNGSIDDGTELFGNFTDQPASEVPNGFIALAVFDDPANGGNNDGWITADDAIFTSLQLWADANHDGISQPDELTMVSDTPIEGIDLDYHESGREDQHGNRFRYTSKVFRKHIPGVPRVTVIV